MLRKKEESWQVCIRLDFEFFFYYIYMYIYLKKQLKLFYLKVHSLKGVVGLTRNYLYSVFQGHTDMIKLKCAYYSFLSDKIDVHLTAASLSEINVESDSRDQVQRIPGNVISKQLQQAILSVFWYQHCN